MFIRDAFLGAIIGLLFLLVAFFILLLNGPIAVPFLNNWAQEKLNTEFPDYQIEFNFLKIGWGGKNLPIIFSAQDIRIKSIDGNLEGNVAGATFGLDATKLLQSEVAFSEIILNSPILKLIVNTANSDQLSAQNEIIKSLSQNDQGTINSALQEFMAIDYDKGTLLNENWTVKLNYLFSNLRFGELNQISLGSLEISLLDVNANLLASLGPIDIDLSRMPDGNNELTVSGNGLQSNSKNTQADGQNTGTAIASATIEPPPSLISLKLGYNSLKADSGSLSLRLRNFRPSNLPEAILEYLPPKIQDSLRLIPNEMIFNSDLTSFIDSLGRPIKAALTLSANYAANDTIETFFFNSDLTFKEGIKKIDSMGKLQASDVSSLLAFLSAEALKDLPITYQGDLLANYEIAIGGEGIIESASLSLIGEEAILTPLEQPPNSFSLINAPLAIENMEIEMHYLPDQLALDKFNFYLKGFNEDQTLAPRIAVTGAINGLTLGGGESNNNANPLILDIAANLTNYKMEWLKQHWPIGLAEDARNWVTKNIDLGDVPKADIFTSLEINPQNNDFKIITLSGNLVLDEARVTYIDELPPALNVFSTAIFDQSQFKIKVQKGDIDGIALTKGNIFINNLDKPRAKITIDLELDGSIQVVNNLLRIAPYDYLNQFEYQLDQVTGDFTGRLSLAFPLKDDLTEDEVIFATDLDLSPISFEIAEIKGKQESNNLLLKANNEALQVMGDILWHPSLLALASNKTLEPLAFNVNFNKYFSPKAVLKSKTAVQGKFTPELLKQFGYELPFYMAGEVGYSLEINTPPKNGVNQYNLKMNLSTAQVDLPLLGYQKSDQTRANILLNFQNQGQGIWQFKQIDYVDDQGTDLKGSLSIYLGDILESTENSQVEAMTILDRVQSITFAPFNIGKNALNNLAWQKDSPNHYQIMVKGDYASLDPLLQEDENAPAAKAKEKEESIFDQINLNGVINLNNLEISKNANLPNLSTQFESKLGYFENFLLKSNTAQGQSLLDIQFNRTQKIPTIIDENDQPIQIIPNGRVLRASGQTVSLLMIALGIEGNVEGGKFDLVSVETDQNKTMTGTLTVDKFTVIGAPAMAKLLQALSLTGIFDTLTQSGLEFNQLISHFHISDNKITIMKSVADGLSLGMTGKGTIDFDNDYMDIEGVVIPAYGINKIISSVPIIGSLLTGVNKEGVIATRYNMQGSINEPKVSSSVLSTFTPGFFRDLLGGIFLPSSEPKPEDQLETKP